jgi:hypothetical protein
MPCGRSPSRSRSAAIVSRRAEAYNALNHNVWDQPDTTFGSGTFGQVTRKRTDASGREIQLGLRFVF